MMTNINIIPVQTFAHPDQLFYCKKNFFLIKYLNIFYFYYIIDVGNLNMNISEENIIKCIDGFLSLSDQI